MKKKKTDKLKKPPLNDSFEGSIASFLWWRFKAASWSSGHWCKKSHFSIQGLILAPNTIAASWMSRLSIDEQTRVVCMRFAPYFAWVHNLSMSIHNRNFVTHRLRILCPTVFETTTDVAWQSYRQRLLFVSGPQGLEQEIIGLPKDWIYHRATPAGDTCMCVLALLSDTLLSCIHIDLVVANSLLACHATMVSSVACWDGP